MRGIHSLGFVRIGNLCVCVKVQAQAADSAVHTAESEAPWLHHSSCSLGDLTMSYLSPAVWDKEERREGGRGPGHTGS